MDFKFEASLGYILRFHPLEERKILFFLLFSGVCEMGSCCVARLASSSWAQTTLLPHPK
jgi:hypothetical protein